MLLHQTLEHSTVHTVVSTSDVEEILDVKLSADTATSSSLPLYIKNRFQKQTSIGSFSVNYDVVMLIMMIFKSRY